MGGRLIIAVLAAVLAFTATALPCAAMLVNGPQDKSGHECCDETKGDSHHGTDSQGQTSDECALICAMATAAYTAPTTATIEKQCVEAPLFANAGEPRLLVPSPRVDKTHRPPDHAPPLYVVNAAFLI